MNNILSSNILKNILKVFSGNLFSQGIAFIVMIIVARNLSVSDYGVYSLFISLFTFIILFIDFGASTSYVKFLSENIINARDIFISNIIVKVLFSFILMIAIIIFSSEFSYYFFSSKQYTEMIKVISISIIFHSVLNLIQNHYHAIQNFNIFNNIKIIHNILKLISVLFICVVVAREKYLEWFLISYIYASVLIVLFFLISNINIIFKNIKIKKYYITEVYKIGFFIFLCTLATSVLTRIDIVMLNQIKGDIEVGVYSVASNLAMIIPLITSSVMVVLLPQMHNYFLKYSKEQYIYIILSNIKIVLLILFILEFLSSFLIYIFFGEKFSNSTSVFQILLVANIFGVIINPISLVLLSINKVYILMFINFSMIPTNYLMNLFFIEHYGASGAALTTTIINLTAGLITIVFAIFYSRRLKL